MIELSDHVCIISFLPEPDPPRSNVALAVGLCVHLLILAFAVVLVWTAKPSSSKC